MQDVLNGRFNRRVRLSGRIERLEDGGLQFREGKTQPSHVGQSCFLDKRREGAPVLVLPQLLTQGVIHWLAPAIELLSQLRWQRIGPEKAGDEGRPIHFVGEVGMVRRFGIPLQLRGDVGRKELRPAFLDGVHPREQGLQ